MTHPELADLVDWITDSLRWLALLFLVISAAYGARLSAGLVVVFLLAALWNISLTVLAVINRRPKIYRWLSVIGDALIAYLLIYLDSALGWAGILPILSAALFYQGWGVVTVTLANLLIQGGLAFFAGSSWLATGFFAATSLILYLALGFSLSFIEGRMLNLILQGRQGRGTGPRDSASGELERRQAIYALISSLSASLNYQRILESALDLTTSALLDPNDPAEKLVSAVLLFSGVRSKGNELHVGSARRFTPADLRISLPGAGGLLGLTLEDGRQQLTINPAVDPELGRIIALRTCSSACCLPLRSGLDTYGVLLFAHPDQDFFTSERCEVLDIVAKQVMIAMQNARLYQDLELEKERMLEIQEEARKKMARDLHDGPTQSVAAIAMEANYARRLMDRDAKAAANELFKIEDLARRTTKEIRHMLFTLRPLVLESQGLIAALESMAVKMRETYNQNVIIQADKQIVEEMEISKQTVAFYIVEEAVNNARKHAKAAYIWVRLKQVQDDLALLEVEDDGAGFNVNAVDSSYENRGSLGMVNMRERAELVNGLLHVDSAEGQGTRIQVLLPLNDTAAERIRRRT